MTSPTSTKPAQQSQKPLLRNGVPRPKGHRIESGHLFFATLAINFLSLALPIMTLQVYDRILPNPDSGTLPVLIVLVSFAIFCETLLRLARAWMMGWSGAVYEHRLSESAMKRILAADVSRIKPCGIGEFLHRLTAIGKVKEFENGYVLVTVTELAFIPVFLCVIAYIALPLVFVPLVLLLVFIAVSTYQGKRLQRAMDQRDRSDDKRYDFLIECLKGIHSLKAFALEGLFTRRYEHLQEESGRASFKTAEASTAAFNFGTMISHLMMAAVMTAGAIAAIAGYVTTGALIATLQLSGRLMQPAQRGLSLWARYQEIGLAQKKIAAIFSMPRLKTLPAAELPSPTGYLSVQSVACRKILTQVSLDLVPGDAVAIRGASGSGKTILMEMLAGLYPPDSGKILIDGTDIRQFLPEELSRYVGYIATDGAIFHGTIRDNMTRFGTINEAAALDIARRLHVDREVALLPSGYDTVLQPQGGDQVPPGLRQRIAMTRILAAHPKIILFDESDRALDRDGYNLVFGLLAQISRHTAIVLVTDDANLTALAQRHYVLTDGKLNTYTPETEHSNKTPAAKPAAPQRKTAS